MWRHGDVLIAPIDDEIPPTACKHSSTVLVHGEATGHSHRVADPETAVVWHDDDERIYLEVLAEAARIIHEEHHPIELPQGRYRVWVQREYTPGAIRRVID